MREMKRVMFDLSGKVALVTGVSTGIGRGIAAGLAEAGADIAGTYNSHEPDEIKKEIEGLGQKFFSFKADLTNPDCCDEVIQKVVGEFGRIDILVNNAGSIRRTNALQFSKQDWYDVININQNTLYFLCQSAAKQFVKQESRGKIINMASMLSYHGGMNVSSYTASKHAVVGITKILASDLGQYGINVNALAPGWIKTNMSEAIRNNPERSKAIVSRIAMGDWGTPDDFKGVAVFLASEASNYITGVTIPVDGGYLVR